MGQLIGLTIPLEGGLDLVTPEYALAKTPGFLKEMINFESYPGGGYRRINGYKKWSTATPTSATTRLYGVCQYADGVVAVQGVGATVNYNVYWTTDGITWYLVNSASLAGGVPGVSGGSATITGLTATTRASVPGQVQFVVYEGNTEYGELFILDGANNIARFAIASRSGTRYYHFDTITTFTTAQWGAVYKDHLVVGGDTTNKETIYWSDAYAPTSFTGGTSGSLKFPDKITGVRSWRDKLFIFGQNSVNELSGINGVPAVNTISRNMGCLNGHTIQEVGGDLIWLSPDGFRNLAGTERLDDIELGTISRRINPLVEDAIDDITTEDVSSFVIREKNQYRMFHCKSTYTDGQQKGLLATYKMGAQGTQWEWGEIQSIPVACAWSGINRTGSIATLNYATEVVLHGGYDGHVYLHDDSETDSFAGSNVYSVITTPQIDYGDIGVKKTPHWVILNGSREGDNDGVFLELKYDYESRDTLQPSPYNLPFNGGFSYYGSAIYGTSTYSTTAYLNERVLVEGSGFSNSFKIYSQNTQAPYTISGIYVRAYVGKAL